MRVGWGVLIADDGIWLDGHTTFHSPDTSDGFVKKFCKEAFIVSETFLCLPSEGCYVVFDSLFPQAWERTQRKGGRGVLIL